MAYQVNDNLIIDDAHIMMRNFEGRESKFNPKGRMNFCVKLDPVVAAKMKEDGWNVREMPATDEYENPLPYISVTVSLEKIPAKVYLVTKKSKTLLTEDTIKELDHAELARVDLVIRPYNWELASGNHGVKAYLKTGYFTIVEDEFSDRYAALEGPDDLPF